MALHIQTLLTASVSQGGFENYSLYLWIGLFVLAVFVELFTVRILAVWVAAGALIALVLALIPPVPYWGEILAFVLSTALLFAARPLIVQYLKRKAEKEGKEKTEGKK